MPVRICSLASTGPAGMKLSPAAGSLRRAREWAAGAVDGGAEPTIHRHGLPHGDGDLSPIALHRDEIRGDFDNSGARDRDS